MRPHTLAEAVERIRSGAAWNSTLAEFVDRFDVAVTADARYACIVDEPMRHDPKLDALVAAVAEYLAKQRRLGRVPAWTGDPSRHLAEPWYTTATPTAGMKEYLTFSSPAEFASRNIFTEERPLRRARSELTHESSTPK